MTTDDILKLVEAAKLEGLDEIAVDEKLDNATICDLQEIHNFAIYYTAADAKSWLDDDACSTIVTWNEEKVRLSRWAKSLGNTWHYQVIFYDDAKWPYYGLHEVVPKKDGSIGTWTARPFCTGDSVEEIKEALGMMMRDVDKYEPLKKSEIEDDC